MTPIDFYFDPRLPRVRDAFDHLPQLLQGASVMVRYHPVACPGLADPDAALNARLQQAWASASAGHTPSRWACDQLLRAHADEAAAAGLPPPDAQAAQVQTQTRAQTQAQTQAQARALHLMPAASVTAWPVWQMGERVFAGADGLVALAAVLHEVPHQRAAGGGL